jgi:hypothetical protein
VATQGACAAAGKDSGDRVSQLHVRSRLDEPFWKLEGCERQLSDLGWRIVLRRHGDPLS